MPVLLQPNASAHLCPLASPEPDGLSVLLQLGDELIALADHVLVLLVLVVGAICLDDTLAGDAVDCAGDAAGGDEFGEVTRDGQLVHIRWCEWSVDIRTGRGSQR